MINLKPDAFAGPVVRLTETRVPTFRADGTLLDLASPNAAEVDFADVARRLSRIVRFVGGGQIAAVPVAQHCVMGAEALLNEGESTLTAALFLLHDGHEKLIGDQTRPFHALVLQILRDRSPAAAEQFAAVMADIKCGWDKAIYAAAGLPDPTAWTAAQKKAVERMDERMAAAEIRALYGRHAGKTYPVDRYPQPKIKGSFKPWGPAKAEERFIELFIKLIGREKFAASTRGG